MRPSGGKNFEAVNVHLASAADIAAMIDLERRCGTAAHWTEGQFRAALPACGAALATRLMLVVDEAGSEGNGPMVRGFLVARHVGAEWELENIVVEAGSRRKRFGTRLLEELLGRVRAAGSESVHLEVRESNEAARAFYETWGFEESGRRKGYYRDPPEDAVLYRRRVMRSGSQNGNVAP